jgi:uridine kinase
MREIVEEDLPIGFRYIAYADALDVFTRNGQTDTALLLEQRSDAKVPINECRAYQDLSVSPLVPRTSILSVFELKPYENGFILRYPHLASDTISAFEDSPRIFSVYKEYKKWGRIVGVNAVGNLNRLVDSRDIKSFIQIAEAFQEKKLSEIADRIYEKRDSVRVILIAGPSSSGKTTTAKRLAIQLKVMGLEPMAIALDDYFLGREKTPKDEKGEPDYECLEALDVPLLNKQLLALFRGDEVELPSFDFKIGARKETGKKMKLGRRTILVIEGIHGLNDALTHQIDRDRKFKLYVSALTQLNLDDHNRIPTSDNRLIRRMVRDNQFRSHSAAATIKMWPNVQLGEKKHIFPFQDSADVAFNSALDYELSVLKVYAEPLLRSVKPTMKEYSEAIRLLSFLENFTPIPPQYVPGQSILREFIGESEFKY